MSVEALAFAKLTDLGKAESAAIRLLFYVVAENTFNDSGLCKVGQEELCYQTRAPLRSTQRRLKSLAGAGIITVDRRSRSDRTGRLPDAIKIIGFKEWLSKEREESAARDSDAPGVSQDDDPLDVEGPDPHDANLACCQTPSDSTPATRQQVAGINKDYSRTSDSRTNASRAQAPGDAGISDDLDIDLKKEDPKPRKPKKPKSKNRPKAEAATSGEGEPQPWLRKTGESDRDYRRRFDLHNRPSRDAFHEHALLMPTWHADEQVGLFLEKYWIEKTWLRDPDKSWRMWCAFNGEAAEAKGIAPKYRHNASQPKGETRRVGLDTEEGRERIAWIAKNAPGLLEGIKAKGYVIIEDPVPVLEAAE